MSDLTVATNTLIRSSSERSLYHVREVRMDQDLTTVLSAWQTSNSRYQDHTVFADPQWLQARCQIENANIRAYLLEQDSRIVGALPLEFYHHRLACTLGDLEVTKVPLKMFRLLGNSPNLPGEESAHDLLFHRLLAVDFDAIYMTGIKPDSFFWRYLRNSPLIKRHFYFYTVRGPIPHPFIRVTGSFAAYMQKFSSKSRNNLSRQLRKLRDKGELELVSVTNRAEVNSFVDAAAEISRKTYQFRVLGIGIRNPDQLKAWLQWVAQQGWLRSYLLKCAGVPCAFQVAYQYNQTFFGLEVGYDPAWSKLGVGIVQQLLALEDIFNNNPPNICDFGAYADYKQFLANDVSSDALIWLFRRRPYPLFALTAFRLFSEASKTAGSALDRLNLKSKVKHFLRR
jgi:hypothetical protein